MPLILVLFIFFGLLILLVVALLVTLMTKKKENPSAFSSLGPILGTGIFVLLGMVVFGYLFTARRSDRMSSDLRRASQHAMAPPLEDEWEHPQRPRISINDPEPSPPSSDPGDTSPEETTEEKKQKRPDWVDAPPKLVGEVYSRVVSSGPYSTVRECHQALEPWLLQATGERLEKLVSTDDVWDNPSLQSLGISTSYILQEIHRDDYIEELETSVGNMKRVHVLLEFRAAQDDHLMELWRRHQRQHRLVQVSFAASLFLTGLGLVYGFLKIDTQTQGTYTKRLLFGGVVVILVLIGVFIN